MLAIECTLLAIITLPILIPWLIWANVMWVWLKRKYGKCKATLLMRAYVDSSKRTIWSEILKYVIWPYGIATRTREIVTYFKCHDEEG